VEEEIMCLAEWLLGVIGFLWRWKGFVGIGLIQKFLD
jgi:hypothetical protein